MNLTDRKPYQPHFSVIGFGNLLTFAIRLSGPNTVELWEMIGNILPGAAPARPECVDS